MLCEWWAIWPSFLFGWEMYPAVTYRASSYIKCMKQNRIAPKGALHYRVILRELVTSNLPSYTSTANAATKRGYKNSRLNLMFVDPCIIVQFIKKNPTRCNNVSKFYYSIFIWSSTCFGGHTAHHQEPKTALAASGFLYVEGCWTCSWWTLSGTVCLTTSTNYTSNSLPRMKNQWLPMQFQAPDDGRCVARNMLNFR